MCGTHLTYGGFHEALVDNSSGRSHFDSCLRHRRGSNAGMVDHKQSMFDSIYSHGFARVAAAMPSVDVASPEFNVDQTLQIARRAAAADAVLVVFPELGLSAYSNEDLFLQDALLDAVETGLVRLLDASLELPLLLVVGAPLRSESRLFNCAVVIYRGRILGITPKTYLPNYREFYEKRQFTSGAKAVGRTIRVLGETVPFGNDIMFQATNRSDFTLHIEICEDVWVPLPPSTLAALAGATILANLSASNSIVGKADYRRLLCSSQSAKCIAAYLYTAAGPGESTTDLAWDGHSLIYENGERLAESSRFAEEPSLTMADLDLDRLRQERMRMTSFSDCVAAHHHQLEDIRIVPFHLEVPKHNVPIRRDIQRFPYVPADPLLRDERCNEVYNIQVQGLTKRLQATGLNRVVIGISGGLDSTQAALVIVRAFDQLKLPRENILGVTLPGFATSAATLANARDLMRCLRISAKEIDIRPSAQQMFSDIGHPFSRGEPVYDLTFENVQAGERTSHLFRLANYVNGFVVGTGDLSELALGFTTYGVGDQMSHYNVNASVPKTLIQYLIRWLIKSRQFDDETLAVLARIVNLRYSAELVPGKEGAPSQTAEEVVGPYELHDFFLYYLSRFGFRPSKVAFLTDHAWRDANQGSWPEIIPPESRTTYDLSTICHWLEVFLVRFFQLSQFKRSAMPNGPKVGSGGSLSPRSDWRAPSDAHADVWIQELRNRMSYRLSPGDALIIVDVQNDFCPGGALAVIEGDKVVPVLNEWITAAEAAEVPVFASRDWHPANHISFRDRGGPWPPHCVQGTAGAEFHRDLKLPHDVQIISKADTPDQESYSAFGGTDLAAKLRQTEIRRVWIGGLTQDYCVRETALDALREGFEVHVIVDATRAVNVKPEDGRRALEEIRQAGGILEEMAKQ